VASGDRQRWNDRYRQADGPPGSPAPLLVTAVAGLAAGRALDLACGRGSDALWLAGQGWTVDAVDVSDEALAALARHAGHAGVAARVRTVPADLDDGLPSSLGGPYDLLVMGRFRSPVLEEAVGRMLRPGAMVVTSRLSVVGRGPDDRSTAAFLASPGELRGLAERSGLEVLHLAEADGVTALVARVKPAVESPRLG